MKRAERVEKARNVTDRRRDEAPSTQPGHRLAAARGGQKKPAPAPGSVRRSEAATLPPPAATDRRSGMRAKRTSVPAPSATVDEVVADLSRDPRREDDD
jgi:hypothetical protein